MEEIKLQDIVQAIQTLSDRMDRRMDHMESETMEAIHTLAEQVYVLEKDLKGEIGGLKGEIGGLKGEINNIKTVMVTKNYLDEKLADLRGDLIVLSRKSNTKLSTLVEELVKQGSLKRKTADQILALEPFAQV